MVYCISNCLFQDQQQCTKQDLIIRNFKCNSFKSVEATEEELQEEIENLKGD